MEKKACELQKANAYQAILMDISMPVMNGTDATQNIREYEAETGLTRTPIIAVTAHAMAGDRQRFLDVGMDDYITKPVNKDIIIATLEKYVARSETPKAKVA